MAVMFSYPKGPLKSFNGHDFISDRSQLQPNWSDQTTQDAAGIIGGYAEVDLAGLAPLAIHSIYTWSYSIHCTGSITPANVQDELDLLATLLHTVNTDGSTGQVGLLTVQRQGYPSGPDATGTARLVSIESLEETATRTKLALQFWIPQGLQYTV